MKKTDLGHKGEAVAAKYYLDRGYTLLEHNYRTRLGELDLLLKKGDILVAVEVKTRSKGSISSPAEAVTPAKQRKVAAALKGYLASMGGEEPNVRFDVVEVFPQPEGGYRVHCIPNAFTCV